MLTFPELTPQFKKLKRRASLAFCVHIESNRNRLFSLQNGVWDFQNSEYLKSHRDFTLKVLKKFCETQAKETWEKDFKTMKNENFKIPRHRFVKQTIPI